MTTEGFRKMIATDMRQENYIEATKFGGGDSSANMHLSF